jgi:hypothetical protein
MMMLLLVLLATILVKGDGEFYLHVFLVCNKYEIKDEIIFIMIYFILAVCMNNGLFCKEIPPINFVNNAILMR